MFAVVVVIPLLAAVVALHARHRVVMRSLTTKERKERDDATAAESSMW
jgi:hypothetical protein